MKKYAVACASALIVLLAGFDSAGAERTRKDEARVVPKRDRGQPEMRERANCEQVGSGLYVCELQSCREDVNAHMSICEISTVPIDG